jgi:ribosomal protein L11
MYCTLVFFNNDLEIEKILYLKIKSQNAITGPPVGPILSQCGIIAASFCKDFNDRTLTFKPNILLYVTIYVYSDNSYDFDINLPSDSYFLQKACKLRSGMRKPGWICSEIQIMKSIKNLLVFKCITPYLIYEVFLYKSKYDEQLSLNLGHSICKKLYHTLKTIGLLAYTPDNL